MAGRIAFEILIFLIPFMLFGLYVLVTTNADPNTKRKWPINMLFLSGLALAALGFIGMIVWEKINADPALCKAPNRYVDGQIVEGETFPCEHNNADAGRPKSNDPGGAPEPVPSVPDGVPDPDPRLNDPN